MAEERTPLLTVEQFKQLARPTGNHIDEEEVKVFNVNAKTASLSLLSDMRGSRLPSVKVISGTPFFRDSMQIPSSMGENTLLVARIRAARISRS